MIEIRESEQVWTLCVLGYSKQAHEILMGYFLSTEKALIYLDTILQKLSESPSATPDTMKKFSHTISRLAYTFNRKRKT